MSSHKSTIERSERIENTNQLIQRMRDSDSPVRYIFKGLRLSGKALGKLGSRDSALASVSRSMIHAFLHGSPDGSPGGVEVIMANTILDTMFVESGESKKAESCVYLETAVSDEGDGITTMIRSGEWAAPKLQNELFSKFNDLPIMDRTKVAAQLGLRLLKLVHEREEDDSEEKTLAFDASEVYAHFGMMVENIRHGRFD